MPLRFLLRSSEKNHFLSPFVNIVFRSLFSRVFTFISRHRHHIFTFSKKNRNFDLDVACIARRVASYSTVAFFSREIPFFFCFNYSHRKNKSPRNRWESLDGADASSLMTAFKCGAALIRLFVHRASRTCNYLLRYLFLGDLSCRLCLSLLFFLPCVHAVSHSSRLKI